MDLAEARPDLEERHPWEQARMAAIQQIVTAAGGKFERLEPEDAKTFYLLARARFEKGDRPGAQAAIEQALKRVAIWATIPVVKQISPDVEP